jgi:hypothetical protein
MTQVPSIPGASCATGSCCGWRVVWERECCFLSSVVYNQPTFRAVDCGPLGFVSPGGVLSVKFPP